MLGAGPTTSRGATLHWRWGSANCRLTLGMTSGHVDDPSQRPTKADCDGYPWLVRLVKKAGCYESVIYRSHPFLIKDVLFSAFLVEPVGEVGLVAGDLVKALDPG